MMAYSAIAGSWPNTLQIVTPFGTAPVSRRSSPAATDCSRRRRGAGGHPRAPDMTDHDLRIRQQRGKLRRIVLVVEDRGLQRRLDLGENPRRHRGGEMAEKQGFHVLPSPTHDERHDCGASASLGKEFESRTHGAGMSARGTLIPHDPLW